MDTRMSSGKKFLLLGLALSPGLFAAGPAGASWTVDGTPVCTNAQTQANPAIVADGAGGAIIFWEDSRSGLRDIYAQRVNSDGTTLWSDQGIAVCSATADQVEPAACRLTSGGAGVVWVDARNAAGSSHWDIYGQVVDASGVPQWTGNGLPLASSSDFEDDPQIISDFNPGHIGTRGFIMSFTRFSTNPSYGEIAVQRFSALGDGTWTTPSAGGVRVSGAKSSSIERLHPSLATDGLAVSSVILGAVVAWQEWDTHSSNPSHIQINRVNSLAAVQWGSSGISITATQFRQEYPSVANEGAVTVTSWVDKRSDLSGDIYAQKLDGAGTRLWLADGVPVCRAPGTQTTPVTVAGTSGNSIIVWSDVRSGNYQLYAQALDTNGQALWGTDGVLLCSAPGYQYGFRAIPDGSGGAIVVWHDHRGVMTDLYAQRIDPTGTLLWGLNGVPISAAAGDQGSPALVSDNNSGAIVAWDDHRAASDDIYAVRSYDTNNVTAVPDALPSRFGLALVSPNPGRGPAVFSLDLPEPTAIRADVFDVTGRRIQGLVGEEVLAAGPHELRWDGNTDAGAPAPSGVYMVRVRIGPGQQVVKIVRTR